MNASNSVMYINLMLEMLWTRLPVTTAISSELNDDRSFNVGINTGMKNNFSQDKKDLEE